MPLIAAPTQTELYPAPFPDDDVPTVILRKLSVKKLLDGDDETAKELFEACTTEGFFYLDLTTDSRGQKFLVESEQLHEVAKEVFNNVSMEEKLAYEPGDPMKEHLDWG